MKLLVFMMVFTFSLASCKDCALTVKTLLNNKVPLEETEWTKVQVSCKDDNNTALVITSPHKNAIIKVYFANDVKNILQVSLLGTRVRGYRYQTPHGEAEEFMGHSITREGSKIETVIPREWFPNKLTRMSASVEVDDVIHNYYGIFNYILSIPDTMVVEEYMKMKCCLTEL